jgi:hypothetical protein
VQYLSFLRGIDEEMLTARANVPRLAETSRRMLAKLDQTASTADGPSRDDFARSTARDRAIWVTRIFHSAMGAAPVRWGRVVGGVLAAGLAAVLLVRSVQSAIAYHPIYVDRVGQMTRMNSQLPKPIEGDRGR